MTTWDIIYYTIVLSGFAYLFSLIIAVHKPMWLLYCMQAALLGIYFSALDGDLARWLNLDSSNDNLSLVTGVMLLVFGFLSQAYLITSSHSLAKFKRLLYALAFVSLCVLPLGFVAQAVVLQVAIVALVILGLLSMLLPPMSWSFLPAAAKRLAMPAIVITVLITAIVLLLGLTIFEITAEQAKFIRHLIMVWAIAAGVVTMAYMTRNIEHTRRREANRALRSAKKEAELANSLYQAEVEYSRVRELALQRRDQLQGMSHDLRQPLFSLRSALNVLADNQSQELTTQMHDALEYADQLADSYLSNPFQSPEQLKEDQPDSPFDTEGSESVEVSIYLETLQRMFQNQADNNGIEFRVCPSSIHIDAQPTAIMRILTNLVANALQHAKCRRVLLGVRRTKDGACLEIHDDGVGIELNGRQPSDAKDTNPGNNGLGLGIVAELCQNAGFTWQPVGVPGKGSVMRIGIPAAQIT